MLAPGVASVHTAEFHDLHGVIMVTLSSIRLAQTTTLPGRISFVRDVIRLSLSREKLSTKTPVYL